MGFTLLGDGRHQHMLVDFREVPKFGREGEDAGVHLPSFKREQLEFNRTPTIAPRRRVGRNRSCAGHQGNARRRSRRSLLTRAHVILDEIVQAFPAGRALLVSVHDGLPGFLNQLGDLADI